MPDDTCSMCQRPLRENDWFLCQDCQSRERAIQAARQRDADATACRLRSLGLHPGLHRDDGVARA